MMKITKTQTTEVETMTTTDTNVYNAATINIYQMPESGATVIFSDGSKWTMKQNGRFEWGLYDVENNVLHSTIGSHRGMVEFCAAINQQDRFLKDITRKSV